MSKRLEILKGSLDKKQSDFDAKLNAHFSAISEANGQPLNDKRNGQATLSKWERQNDSLRNLNESIKKTTNAIEREENKIAFVEYVNESIPSEILELVRKGVLTQWRKHPETFFVAGVDKARIVWDSKKKVVAHRYVSHVTDVDMRRKFAKVYNSLHKLLAKDPA